MLLLFCYLSYQLKLGVGRQECPSQRRDGRTRVRVVATVPTPPPTPHARSHSSLSPTLSQVHTTTALCLHSGTGGKDPNQKPWALQELSIQQRSPQKSGPRWGSSVPWRCVQPLNLLLGGWISIMEIPHSPGGQHILVAARASAQ